MSEDESGPDGTETFGPTGAASASAAHHAMLRVEYDGAPFRGWSRQPQALTVEGCILEACAVLGLAVRSLRCAGRTDAGVHATGQIVSLAYDGSVPVDRLARAINSQLHPAVSVLAATPCSARFDARTSAASRAYEYRVLVRAARSPMRAARTLHHPRHLDLDLLDSAARAVLGQHDFTAFTPAKTQHVFFHRTVMESRWTPRADELVYGIRANAFLRHMVRILVGNMLAVGRGDMPLERFTSLLCGAARSDAHHTAPPHALCLVHVDYDVLTGRERTAREATAAPGEDPDRENRARSRG